MRISHRANEEIVFDAETIAEARAWMWEFTFVGSVVDAFIPGLVALLTIVLAACRAVRLHFSYFESSSCCRIFIGSK